MNKSIQERDATTLPGMLMVVLLLIFTAAVGWWVIVSFVNLLNPIASIVVLAFVLFLWAGFFIVQPNQAAVLQFFGKFVGVERASGLRWTNPLYTKKQVTLRVRNFESSKLKVNDIEGSPIEIAAVVVWQVHDSAEAVFNVDSYEDFVHVQSEAALRQMATSYPYDLHEDHKVALRSHSREINEHLKREIEERLRTRRRDGARSARQSPRLRAGDRAGDAAASAGGRDHRGAHAHRRRRGHDRAHGARPAGGERRRAARRGAQGRDGLEPARRVVRRARRDAGREHGHAVQRVMAEKKAYPLRISSDVLDALQRWAQDELRSLNAQIEYVLREALRKAGRMKPGPEERRRSQAEA